MTRVQRKYIHCKIDTMYKIGILPVSQKGKGTNWCRCPFKSKVTYNTPLFLFEQFDRFGTARENDGDKIHAIVPFARIYFFIEVKIIHYL